MKLDRRKTGVWIVLLHRLATALAFIDCDKIFKMEAGGPLSGSLESPNFGAGQKYPPDVQCIVTLIAEEGWRVELRFESFSLAGEDSSCDGDHLDVYAELRDPHSSLLDQPLSGRYCGTVAPPIRVSLFYTHLLVFHSRPNSKGAPGFKATYTFVSDEKYRLGSPVPGTVCDFTISGRESGVLMSPTYPGAYPANLECSYRLVGRSGQRIRLFFQDLDLYFGGEHCPYDAVIIHDGASAKAPIVRKLCGIQQKLSIFSYAESLFMVFRSRAPPQAHHRGFLLRYEFSASFVDVKALIASQSGVSHLRGTQCDIRVQSNRETTHLITSPGYPHQYLGNTSCLYILDGLQGVQDLEKVVLDFHAFSIASQVGDCVDGQLAAYTRGQDWASEQPDEVFCTGPSNPSLPPQLHSQGPRLALRFRSAPALRAQGFKASVRFRTDFGIEGTPVGDASNKCQFRFDAESGMEGFFNSPRYPSNYPVDTKCIYFLDAGRGRQVRLYMEQFALDSGEETSGGRGSCGDWLGVWDVWEDGRERLMGKYCAHKFPGPIVSSHGASSLRLVFNSDKEGTMTGFKALYDFIPQPASAVPASAEEGCGGVLELGPSGGGWLASPGYPNRYVKNLVCNWELRVPDDSRVLLQPIAQDVEGTMGREEDCRQAVIRVYTTPDATFDHEFCGTDPSVVKHFVSNGSRLRLSFLTSPDKVNGLTGFNFSWTRLFHSSAAESCAQNGRFRCVEFKFCISEALRCDASPNCGHSDNTDESHCAVEVSAGTRLLAGLARLVPVALTAWRLA